VEDGAQGNYLGSDFHPGNVSESMFPLSLAFCKSRDPELQGISVTDWPRELP
jgi:hypothetical protein